MDSSQNGEYAAFKMLLAKKANPNITNQVGDTALKYASKNGNEYVVQLLKLPSRFGQKKKDGEAPKKCI
jgi:ankyrin repeat protein